MPCGCLKREKQEQVADMRNTTTPALSAQDESRITPTTQCIACAQKHCDEAWECFHEYGYSLENRRHIRGSLRAIILHTFKEWPEIAKLARKAALEVQEADDRSARASIDELCRLVDDAFFDANPVVKKRIEILSSTPDVIIPLGAGSASDNAELRYLLRSIERNLQGFGRVILVSTFAPAWINRSAVDVLEVGDRYDHNKDANLHLKTLEAIRRRNVSWFVWCADDNAFMQKIRASWLPILHNHRGRDAFKGDSGSNWRTRVLNTFAWAETRGVNLPYNFECHAPQLFDGRGVLNGMQGVDYGSPPGLTIYTTWRVVTDSWHYSEEQSKHKLTFELECGDTIRNMTDRELCAKPFLGYSDAGVRCGILDRLAKIFHEKSRFEK